MEQVARATLRAIRRDLPERIVNWPPIRPSLGHMVMFPAARERILRALGIYRLCKRAAALNEASAGRYTS